MKAKGSELLAFYHEWYCIPEGFYHDEYDPDFWPGDTQDGAPSLVPAQSYDVDAVFGFWFASEGNPTHMQVGSALVAFPPDYDCIASSLVFCAWRKQRTCATLMVDVPHAARDAFTTFCATNSIKIHK
jgi:hypothetical protein